ncbi:hypothetical protein BDI4_1080010 [Burkholderia diffusa]|nr:hypothetical protein BDI4_1080010 [Burkholderia diffusa]
MRIRKYRHVRWSRNRTNTTAFSYKPDVWVSLLADFVETVICDILGFYNTLIFIPYIRIYNFHTNIVVEILYRATAVHPAHTEGE